MLDARHEREEDQRVVDVVRDRVDGIRALLLGLARLGHARVVKPHVALGGVLGQLLGSDLGEVEEAVGLARDVPLPLLLGREDRAGLAIHDGLDELLRHRKLLGSGVRVRKGGPLVAHEPDAAHRGRPFEDLALGEHVLVAAHGLQLHEGLHLHDEHGERLREVKSLVIAWLASGEFGRWFGCATIGLLPRRRCCALLVCAVLSPVSALVVLSGRRSGLGALGTLGALATGSSRGERRHPIVGIGSDRRGSRAAGAHDL